MRRPERKGGNYVTEEQEQSRLAELRVMADEDTGSVSLLSYETAIMSKMNMTKRLRASLAALSQIMVDPARAQDIAAAALEADEASI
jgi:hypothetical protein